MRWNYLTYLTTFSAAATLMAAACGSNKSDDDGGSLIPLGGAGGGDSGAAAANGGGAGGSAASTGTGGGGFVEPDGSHSGGSGGGTCGGEDVPAKPKPANVLIVMDKSKSMDENLTSGDAGPAVSRWDGVKLALADAVAATQDKVDFGLSVFPYDTSDAGTGGSCAMPTASDPLVSITAGATDESADILDALNSTEPAGGTPTAKALNLALDYFTNGAGAALEGEKYVLLATDGGPNCSASVSSCVEADCTLNVDNQCPIVGQNCCDGAAESCLDRADAVAAVTALASAGIKTFVVGMPGSEAYETTLDALADAGGFASATSPKYFSVSGAGGVDALKQTFIDITIDLVKSCVVVLEENPPDENKVNVSIDGEDVYNVNDLETPLDGGVKSGWDFDKTENPWSIVIQGEACTDLETSGAQSLTVEFGCPRVEPPK
jgi:hypothetical protein